MQAYLEAFRAALTSLAAHRMRSFLTTLGILIGTGSVIAVVSLVQGFSDSIKGQLSDLGGSTLTLRATEITRTDEGGQMNGHHVNGHMNGASPYEAPQAALVAPGASQPSVIQAAAPDEPKRVMAAFKDTHFMRLASSPAPQPQPAMPVAAMPAPAPVEVAPPEAVVAPAPVAEMPPAIAQPAVTIPPPPLPATVLPIAPAAPVALGEPERAIEDATADLLRPMLRQWLAENMPRMVEKALHIEIAESVKPTKKL